MYTDSMIHNITHQLSMNIIPNFIGMMIFGGVLVSVCLLSSYITKWALWHRIRRAVISKAQRENIKLKALLKEYKHKNRQTEEEVVELRANIKIINKALEIGVRNE